MNSPNDSDNDDDSRNTDSIRSRMWHRDDRPESAEHNNDNEPTSSITSTDTDGIQTNETPDTVSQSPSPPRQNTERPSMSDDRTPPTFVPRLRLENIRSIGTQGTERLPPESAFRAFSAAMTTNSPHRAGRRRVATNSVTCTNTNIWSSAGRKTHTSSISKCTK